MVFFILVTSSHVQIDLSLVRKRVNIFVLHCAFFRDELDGGTPIGP